MKTFLGTLKAARFFLQNLVTSASSMSDPSLGMMAQFIYSFKTEGTTSATFHLTNQQTVLFFVFFF